MKGPRERLEADLVGMMARLRQAPEMAPEEASGAGIGRHADEVDEQAASADREVQLGTRELLLERVNRIRAALRRLNDGEYGVCGECGGRIAPARLRALPEVETCVSCQERLEQRARSGRRLQPAGAHDVDDDA